jgi:OHCU decarboxylase
MDAPNVPVSPTQAQLVPIEELNLLPPAAVAAALRPLFEAAQPLADALAEARPFPSYAALLETAERIIEQLPETQQVELLRGHPQIGESAQTVRQSSELSYREQGYALEATVEQDELERTYAELAELNERYEQRFGFRFVVFVNRRPKSEIVQVLKRRLEQPREIELRTGLAEMLAIARDRLRSMLTSDG